MQTRWHTWKWTVAAALVSGCLLNPHPDVPGESDVAPSGGSGHASAGRGSVEMPSAGGAATGGGGLNVGEGAGGSGGAPGGGMLGDAGAVDEPGASGAGGEAGAFAEAGQAGEADPGRALGGAAGAD